MDNVKGADIPSIERRLVGKSPLPTTSQWAKVIEPAADLASAAPGWTRFRQTPSF
jgi:hypothetical protein